MLTETQVHLFVYGTLLASANHPMGHLLHETGQLIGSGKIRGRLYVIDDPEDPGNSYPGAVPSGFDQDHVHGDLYLLHDAQMLIARFDVYEACDPSRPEPHEFLRRAVPVTMEDGQIINAISYFYGWDTSRARLIPDGRFTQIMRDTR